MRVEIDEFVGSWLMFDVDDRSKLGQKLASLGEDLLLGASVLSVEDKIRIRIYVRDFAQYEQFLPTETPNLSEPLADVVFFYIGDELDWDVELAIPSGRGRTGHARAERAARLDDLGVAELDVERRLSMRCPVSSERAVPRKA